jgi:hypothetical protein
MAAVLVILLALAGCAHHYAPSEISDPYGLFSGIWHGFVAPWSIIANIICWVCSLVGISVFESVYIFGQPNTGFWYYTGFVFGFIFLGGAGGAGR